MSSIEHRRNARTGEETWRVRYRHEGANKAVTFTSEADAKAWRQHLDLLGHKAARRLLGEERPAVIRTVTAQIRHHVEHLTGVTDGTRRRYIDMIATHLSGPPLSTTLLHDLTRDHVSDWVNAQQGSPKSVANRHALLSAALTSAERAGLVPTNVAKGVRLPRNDRGRSVTYLTPDEFGAVLRELDPFWWPTALLLVGTGCRWGEVSALQVGDVDLEAGEAHIRRAWKETGTSEHALGDPKTSRSARTVTVAATALASIRRLCEGRPRDAFVLTNRKGGPLHDWWRDRVWKPAVARALPGRSVRVHDLRHTYAAWAIQDGHGLPVIQRQLGHESIKTTVDTYGHLARSDFDPLSRAIDGRLQRAIGQTGVPATVAGEVIRA